MRLALIVALAACGGKTPPPTDPGSGSAEPVGVVRDTRTEIEKRRDAACELVAKKLTQCAVEDAKANLAAGTVTKKQFDIDTSEKTQQVLTEKYIEGCLPQPSSRQVRVLEVCYREETACEPLLACLENIKPQPAK